MQSVLEAANHIAAEIEKTRQHLLNLEQALAGLRPLITVEVNPNVLTYTLAGPGTVEDVAVITPVRKKRVALKSKVQAKSKSNAKSKVKAAVVTSADTIPKTGHDVWMKALGRKKLSLNELTDVVLKNLKLGENAKVTIRNRAGAWLNTAVKKSQVSTSSNRAGLRVYQAIRD